MAMDKVLKKFQLYLKGMNQIQQLFGVFKLRFKNVKKVPYESKSQLCSSSVFVTKN